MSDRSMPHPDCWTGSRYVHICQEPSGLDCIDCGAPAGTPWGPYWCPDCDVTRLSKLMDALVALKGQQDDE